MGKLEKPKTKIRRSKDQRKEEKRNEKNDKRSRRLEATAREESVGKRGSRFPASPASGTHPVSSRNSLSFLPSPVSLRYILDVLLCPKVTPHAVMLLQSTDHGHNVQCVEHRFSAEAEAGDVGAATTSALIRYTVRSTEPGVASGREIPWVDITAKAHWHRENRPADSALCWFWQESVEKGYTNHPLHKSLARYR